MSEAPADRSVVCLSQRALTRPSDAPLKFFICATCPGDTRHCTFTFIQFCSREAAEDQQSTNSPQRPTKKVKFRIERDSCGRGDGAEGVATEKHRRFESK